MKIILESRLVIDPKTNTEKYVEGYFLTKEQLTIFTILAHHTSSLKDKKKQSDYLNYAIDWIKRYNDRFE